MRLTLRTLLAYIDDILEPQDAEEIGKRIEESEFATTLLHRTRDVMRRLRLGTPDLSGRGSGLDPNTVAEYLDNSLAPDRVLDFEKICLESDVQLAEVACCHQILALVLGEPAEVDPTSRQRIYQLPELVETSPTAPGEPADGPPAKPATETGRHAAQRAKEPGSAPKSAPPVPAWLREGAAKRRGWWRTAASVALILASATLLLAVTGQFERGSFLGDLLGFGGGEQLAQQPATAPEPAAAPEPAEVPSEGPPAVMPGEEGAGPGVPAPVEQLEYPGVGRSAVAGPNQPPAPPAPTPESTLATGGAARTMPGAASPQPEVAGPGAVAAPSSGGGLVPGTGPGPATPAPAAQPVPPLAQPPVAEVASNVPNERPGVGGPGAGGPGGVAPGTPPAGPPAVAPVPSEVIGEFQAPMQVLLVSDEESNTWQRLPDRAPLTSGAKYLSLPTYRPQLRLANQTLIWLVDGTQIELLPPDPDGVVTLAVEFGRLLVEAPENEGSRMRLQVGDRSGLVTLADAGARLAIEVARTAVPGANPETQPGPLTANLYATSGKILWQEDARGEPLAVNAPVRLTLNDQPLEAVAVQELPNWIVLDTQSLLDQRASVTVERELAVGRAAVLGLRELADHRRKEVRWLALRCLDCLGDFELMVAALDDPEQKMVWPDYVDRLRAAVVRSPLAAGQVRSAMEKLHGAEGAELYEMLWKYGDGPLGREDAAHLVDYLDHDTLAFRVVAFQTLRRVTKLGINYQPEDTAAKRRPWVEKWRERLESAPPPESAPQGQQGPPQAKSPAPGALLPGAGF
jgi:hypothetical protein